MVSDLEIKEYITGKPGIGDPYGVDPDDIQSPLRPTLESCQYWCKGMPAICKYWENGDPGRCIYEKYDVQNGNIRIYPRGWNRGHCDFLGRRNLCDKYEAKTDNNLDEYICIAPDPFLSGLLKKVMTNSVPPRDTGARTAVPKGDIKGYNEDDDGKGRCDGLGTGKGILNPTIDNLVICPYYKPWHMGFGAIKPKEIEVRNGEWVDKTDYFEYYLPLSFRVFNLRAKLQKCYHWNEDVSTDFILDSAGLYLEDAEFTGRLGACTCNDPNSDLYCTYHDSPPPWLITENIWAQSNSVICNGAKPECPCYTGKWIYCIDDKIDIGDRVSAQQIQELRFYFTDWESQEDFDRYFEKKPNVNDATRTDIYTYGRWQKQGTYPEDSILLGKRVHLCIPPLYWKWEFSDDYLQIEEITYDADSGTNAPDRITFPTLVRDLDSPLNRLFVVYPYPNRDPFDILNNPICGGDVDKEPCIKRNYYPNGNYTAVYGSTVKNATIYVFNLDDFSNVPNYIRDSNRAPIDFNDRSIFYDDVSLFIEGVIRNRHEDIIIGQASSENGFFAVSRVRLYYKKLNKIIILVDFGDGTWDFRKREVWSQWHGGVIVQSDGGVGYAFEHTYDTGTRYLDVNKQTLTPAGTASFNVQPMIGANPYNCNTDVLRVMSVHMHRNPHLFRADDYYYTYFIKTVEELDVTITSWLNIPGTLYYWVQINDVELNQLFSWSIDSAKFVKQNDDGTTTEIPLKTKYPISGTYYGQWYMHPNTCILEIDCTDCSNTCFGFISHDEYTLKVDYSYLKIDNNYNSLANNESIRWPNLDNDAYHFIDTEHDITAMSLNNYSVTNIRGQTANVMVLFKDEEGRLISAQATKLAVNIPKVYCRNVEIKYSYSGDNVHYRLEPSTGWAFDIKPSVLVGSGKCEGGVPPCGDHDLSFYRGAGPMWYPYDSCERINFYGCWASGAYCTMPYEGDMGQFGSPTSRSDYRFCGTERYNAWVSPRGLWLADCATLWTYYYSQPVGNPTNPTGDDVFTGYARIRANINTTLYTIQGWTLPPFGKYGREFVERYMSIDNIGHFSFANISLYAREKRTWMPIVIEKEALYYSFNSFDESVEFDVFHYVNPFNYYRSIDLNEAVDDFTRLRFNEVFDIVTRGPASYPLPTVEIEGSRIPLIVLYAFKDESYLWAWRELYYRDIERNLDEQYKLCFLNVSNMSYLWDLYKDEHRYITDEGAHTITFTPPQFERDVNNCNFVKYPSIKLDNGPERWFKVVYDDYSSTSNVDWQDENQGMVDGSGGGDNPYELTKNDNVWNHNNDTLFDEDYVTTYEDAVQEGRELIISYDAEFDNKDAMVYNRGVVATIPINRLIYLPYEIQNFGLDWVPNPEPLVNEDGMPGQYCWLYGRNMPTQAGIRKININYENLTETICVVKIFISGFRGRTDITNDLGETILYKFCRPAIRVLHIPCGESGDIDDAEVLYAETLAGYPNYFMSLTDAEFNDGFRDNYNIEIEFTIDPKKMIIERTAKLYIQLQVWGDYSVCLYGKPIIQVSEYVSKTEQIWVWEHKYVVSKGSDFGTFNLNGPQKVLRADLDLDNSGVFFPPQGPYTQAVGAQDKIRSVNCSEEYTDSVDISVNKETLKNVELTEQREIYEEALKLDTKYSDDGRTPLPEENTYIVAVPPTYDEFFDEVGADYSFLSMGHSATFLSEKIRWENHEVAQSLEQYDFWRPGGHQYSWKDDTRQARCYIVDELHDIVQAEFVHVDHAGGFREDVANPVESLGYLKKAYIVGKQSRRALAGVDFGAGQYFIAGATDPGFLS